MSKYPKTLGRIEAVWNKLGGEEGVDRFLNGDQIVTVRSNVIMLGSLRLDGEPISLPAIDGVFVGEQWFSEGRHDNVLIRQVDADFAKHFFQVQLVNVKATQVVQRLITAPIISTQILVALGHHDLTNTRRVEISLAHLFKFLRSADRTMSYVCYVPNWKDVVREVHIQGVHGGWRLTTPEISDPLPWRPDQGLRVVSPL